MPVKRVPGVEKPGRRIGIAFLQDDLRGVPRHHPAGVRHASIFDEKCNSTFSAGKSLSGLEASLEWEEIRVIHDTHPFAKIDHLGTLDPARGFIHDHKPFLGAGIHLDDRRFFDTARVKNLPRVNAIIPPNQLFTGRGGYKIQLLERETIEKNGFFAAIRDGYPFPHDGMARINRVKNGSLDWLAFCPEFNFKKFPGRSDFRSLGPNQIKMGGRARGCSHQLIVAQSKIQTRLATAGLSAILRPWASEPESLFL